MVLGRRGTLLFSRAIHPVQVVAWAGGGVGLIRKAVACLANSLARFSYRTEGTEWVLACVLYEFPNELVDGRRWRGKGRF